MTIQEIQEQVRKNVESVVNYLSSEEFRSSAEQASQKLVDLASTASRDALKLAQDVSQQAVSGAEELRRDVTDRAISFVGDLRSTASQLLARVRGSASTEA